MRKYIFIVTSLLFLSSYSQSRKNIYFLIDKKDTLIKKQIATQTNEYEGYRIIDERRIVTDVKRSESIHGDDVEYETFASYSFSFNRKEDTIISKTYFDSLSIIKDRKKFLDTIKIENMFNLNYIFIEPKNCNEFIMRQAEVLTFE
ncbi:hypothetical protein QO206_08320 [Leeuwenhoekiella aequorea]|uniref:hypothetical protein n=1 Tax=Leeuwenhoekiella aequorea TaxID=283736 RepID=UPI00352EBFB1|tara:strand:+ start:1423 stop:1860 length:438 start_codon:yes stop_codon:yes gene_type:complete